MLLLLLRNVFLGVVGFASAVLALIVLQRGFRKASNIAFALFSIGVSGWALGIVAFLVANDPELAFSYAKVYYFSPLLIALAMPIFADLFPNQASFRLKPWAWIIIIYFLALAVPLVAVENFLTSSLVYHDWGKEIVLDKTHYLLYGIFIVGTFTLSLRIFMHKMREYSGLYGAQARLLFVSILISATLGVTFNLALPWVGNYRLIYLGPLFGNVFLITVAYSIIKHRMFDIRLVVARGLAYLFSVIVLGIGYSILSLFVASRLLEPSPGTTTSYLIDIAALIFVAATFNSVKNFFKRITDRFFYRDAYDAQSLIDEMNQTLVTNVELEPLLTKSALIIQENLKTSFCSFHIHETSYFPPRAIGAQFKDPKVKDIKELDGPASRIRRKVFTTEVDSLTEDEKQLAEVLQKNEIEVLARLVDTLDYEVKGIGYIFMGPKESGSLYTKQDLKILEIIANELVIAIENVLRYEEIEQFNVTLQKKIDDATKELTKSNEKLKALDEAKDEFVSMASHQLRTPLTSIKGYISMVLEGDAGKVSDGQKQMLGQALFSSQRMVYLISDLLNVSRLKTGKFIIESTPTYLPEVVESEISQLREGAAAKDLTLSYVQPSEFPVLSLDEMKLRQVIMNFADNAVYYTKAGGRIDIELKNKKSSVELTIKDTGIGVPKADQHRLFTKFYRADNARRARPDGTGLGLFMSKKVIIAQGGSVIFHSKEGEGSTFGFSFPKERLLISETREEFLKKEVSYNRPELSEKIAETGPQSDQ